MNEMIIDRHGQHHGKAKDTRFLKNAVIVDFLADAVHAKTGMNNSQMAEAVRSFRVGIQPCHARKGRRKKRQKRQGRTKQYRSHHT
jgi:hypothetical protein